MLGECEHSVTHRQEVEDIPAKAVLLTSTVGVRQVELGESHRRFVLTTQMCTTCFDSLELVTVSPR